MSMSSDVLADSLVAILRTEKAMRASGAGWPSSTSSLDADLAGMALPTNDAKAKGPKSSIDDASLDKMISTLERAIATQRGVQSAVGSIMGLLFR